MLHNIDDFGVALCCKENPPKQPMIIGWGVRIEPEGISASLNRSVRPSLERFKVGQEDPCIGVVGIDRRELS